MGKKSFRSFSIVVIFILMIGLAAGVFVGDQKAEQRRQQMEESGEFSGEYSIVEKSVEYHGGDHSDYIFVLRETSWFASDKRYAVSVNHADYYRYEEKTILFCAFVWDEETEIYTDFSLVER